MRIFEYQIEEMVEFQDGSMRNGCHHSFFTLVTRQMHEKLGEWKFNAKPKSSSINFFVQQKS